MGPYRPPAPKFLRGSRVLGQTFDQMFGWSPVAGDAFRLFFHSSTAYLGISVGLSRNAPGFLKYFGWFLGLGQGIAAICDAASLIQRAVGKHPQDQASTPAAPVPGATALPPGPQATVLARTYRLTTTPIPQ